MNYIIRRNKRTKFCINRNKIILSWHTFVTTVIILLTIKPTIPQIVPDNSLGNESSKINNELGNSFINKIDGGATRAGNLFHSFDQFSILSGDTAYFNNASNIQNIISRVTGSSISNIDGLIQANSNANLFLLNPNGIILGSNASLNIGGSFFASTASTINFADGVQFNSSDSQSVPLLTVSVPVGLGFTSSPGNIKVEGEGHSLLVNATGAGIPVTGAGQSTTGLKTSPERAIILVGGDVKIEGGILTAPSGQIKIGSVDSGLVKLDLDSNEGWTLNYDSVQSFRDIQLEQLALLDASGLKNGNIFLQGKNITITDPSLLIISNFSSSDSGKVSINASGDVEIVGIRNITNPNAQNIAPARGIVTQNLSSGNAADIEIWANNISLRDFGNVSSASFSSGSSGDIFIVSKGVIELYSTKLPTAGILIGTIGTSSYSSGRAGNLKLNAENLSVRDGSSVGSATLGSADAGDIELNITNNVEVVGGALVTFRPEFISNSFLSSFVGGTTLFGKSGNVLINTKNLSIIGGARIDSSTLAFGSSGSVTINASDSITVDGKANDLPNPSQIVSSAIFSDPLFDAFLNLPKIPQGESGSITINTNQLNVLNAAQISARNDGTGDAGSVRINASFINLDNKSSVTTATASGEGGNISLVAKNLQLRNGSSITATAGEAGSGGNISINTDTLVALDNSDITANALNGRGGNIEITVQGIFGIEPRTRLTPLSDITASSELGINGTVRVDTLATQPISTTTFLENIAQPPGIVSTCQSNSNTRENTFVITGTGGIPPNPDDILSTNSGWYDRSAIAQSKDTLEEKSPVVPAQIIEAQGWRKNADGTIVLTAEPTGEIALTAAANVGCNQASATKTDTNIKSRDRQ